MIYYIKNKYISLAVNSDGGSMASVNYLGEERLIPRNRTALQDIPSLPLPT